jgi:NAD(P)-dependent dehydrogenase (short-subunit alcohol dehydrogenase family)
VDLKLKGKSVLVTGGSKGIGLACVRTFVAEGCRVHLASRDPRQVPDGVTAHAVDLRDAAALQKLAAQCADVDILLNNAGDIPGGTLESLDDAKWRHAWELKVFGYINLTRTLFAAMKARRSGVIVNVIGMAAENPSPEYICGATANAGLAAFTKALGKGAIEHGVRVVGVHPPSTRTDRILQVMKAAAKAKLGDENRYPELVGKGGMFGQMIEPEHVADTVAFLASPRAGQLSGIVLNLGT